MRRIIGIAVVGVAALVAAGVATHRAMTANPTASVAPAAEPAAPAAAAVPVAAPVAGEPLAVSATATASPVVTSGSDEKVQTTVVRRRVVTRRAPRYYVHKRSTKNSVAIIGGSTLAGAGLGAVVGGKKGALIGGLVGGTAGTVYDRKTRKRVRRVE